MKRDYSKWCSVALICAIYLFAGIAGWFLFRWLTAQAMEPVWALLLADVLATIVVPSGSVSVMVFLHGCLVASGTAAAYRELVLGLASDT